MKNALKSSTIKWLIFFATILSAILMNQDLLVDLVGEKALKWIEMISVIVGAIVPAKSRLDTEKKAPLMKRPEPKVIKNIKIIMFLIEDLLSWLRRKK